MSYSAIQGNNAELMLHISRLYIREGDVVADVTYGRGAFWKLTKEPDFKHDLILDGTDCRDLPHGNKSLDVVVLDPPYRPGHDSKGFQGNGMAAAYQLGHLETINDILDLYEGALKEANRVLKKGGRVLVKCQDLSYANRLHLVSIDILRQITETGFEFVDQFILVNTPNLKSGAWKKQERARRSHSVMWVARKTKDYEPL